ncbi:MAG: SEC-C metal-binding domain-containing protein [Kofleriaceae bacterium]
MLGDDADATSHAIAIDTIRAVADAIPAGRWQLPPGAPSPAGHVKCPCGSGARYRDCCRAAPEPS